MNKKIYYFNKKFPDEIKSFIVEDIEYAIKEVDKTFKYITGIDTYYDFIYLQSYGNEDYLHHYDLLYYDNDIFMYTKEFTELYLSFNKEQLEELRLYCIERFDMLYGKHVDKCREILKEANNNEGH